MKLQIMPPKKSYYIFCIHLVNINYQVKETKKNRVIVLFSETMSTTYKSHLKKGIFSSTFLEKISRGLKYVICMANKCMKKFRFSCDLSMYRGGHMFWAAQKKLQNNEISFSL